MIQAAGHTAGNPALDKWDPLWNFTLGEKSEMKCINCDYWNEGEEVDVCRVKPAWTELCLRAVPESLTLYFGYALVPCGPGLCTEHAAPNAPLLWQAVPPLTPPRTLYLEYGTDWGSHVRNRTQFEGDWFRSCLYPSQISSDCLSEGCLLWSAGPGC